MKKLMLVAAYTGFAGWVGWNFFVPHLLPNVGSTAFQYGLAAGKIGVVLLIAGAPWAHLAILRRTQTLWLDGQQMIIQGTGILRIETRQVARQDVSTIEPYIRYDRKTGKVTDRCIRVKATNQTIDFGRGLYPDEMEWLIADLRARLGLSQI